MSANTQASLVGNLTRDPELKHTAQGKAVVNFSMAVNDSAEHTSYYDVTAWGDLAINASNTLSKGMRAVVFGTLYQSSWETQDGGKRSKVQVTAEAIGPDLRFATAHVVKVASVETPRSNEPRAGNVQDVKQILDKQFPGATVYERNEEPF